MRVLLCPSAFPGSLTALQAAEAIAAGWRARAPHDELDLVPLGDGGAGFVQAIASARGGVTVGTTVSDPLGREVPAGVLLVDDGPVRTAYVDSASAAGLHLLAANERDPGATSTYGVGELVKVALAEGAQRIVVGVGDTATNDAGAGLLAALGAGRSDELSNGGSRLAGLDAEALVGLEGVRARLRDVELVLATDDLTPLTGLSGTSAVHAPLKGATPPRAQELERAVGHFVRLVRSALPTTTDLFTGLERRLDRDPGAGAGGGLGYGLLALGARRTSAVQEVLRACDFTRRLTRADLVVTATGRFDERTLRDSIVAAVAEAAAARALPTVVIAGEMHVGRRETMAMGLSGCYAVAGDRAGAQAALADPIGTLRARAERVATTWSPRP